jgi:DNA-directed RNA polymerase II subunit RPB1
VEAARESILSELTEVIEFDGAYINDHHKTLLADRMTCTTPITSIFRHGVNRDELFISTKNGYIPDDSDFGKSASMLVQELIEQGQISKEDVVAEIHCMHPKFLEH